MAEAGCTVCWMLLARTHACMHACNAHIYRIRTSLFGVERSSNVQGLLPMRGPIAFSTLFNKTCYRAATILPRHSKTGYYNFSRV